MFGRTIQTQTQTQTHRQTCLDEIVDNNDVEVLGVAVLDRHDSLVPVPHLVCVCVYVCVCVSP